MRGRCGRRFGSLSFHNGFSLPWFKLGIWSSLSGRTVLSDRLWERLKASPLIASFVTSQAVCLGGGLLVQAGALSFLVGQGRVSGRRCSESLILVWVGKRWRFWSAFVGFSLGGIRLLNWSEWLGFAGTVCYWLLTPPPSAASGRLCNTRSRA